MAQNQKKIDKRTIIGLLGCLGGLFSHFVIGSVFQWGIINVYVTSYYKLTNTPLTLEANSIAFPLMMLGISLTITPGIILAQKTHPLFILSTVTIIQSALVFASSYMTHIWGFFALFGIIFGLVTGLNFMIAIVECDKYFPGKKMYINGFILIGSGCGPLIFGMFSYNFLNPQKLPNKQGYYYGTQQLENIAAKVPQCIRWLSLMYLILGLLACIFLIGVCKQNRNVEKQSKKKQCHQQISQSPNTNNQVIRQGYKLSSSNNLQTQPNILQKQNQSNCAEKNQQKKKQTIVGQPQNIEIILCSKVFWIGLLLYIFGTLGTLFINVTYKTYEKHIMSDDHFLTIIGAISSLGNGFSRIFWGILFQKTGYKFVLALNLLTQIIIYSVFRFVAHVPALYFITILFNGICLGGVTAISAIYCQLVFSTKWGSKVFGIYVNGMSISNFIQYGLVIGLAPLITLDGIIYICLGIVVFIFIVMVCTNFQGPWKNSTQHLQYCIKLNDKIVTSQ